MARAATTPCCMPASTLRAADSRTPGQLVIAPTSDCSASSTAVAGIVCTKLNAEAQSTCPAAIIDTSGFFPEETSSVSMRAPSLANCAAIFASIGATRLAAADSTRSRSCGSGWGRATADCTTSSTNFLRDAAFELAATVCAALAGVDFVAAAFCFREGEVTWALANETLIKQDITSNEEQRG